MIFDPMRPLPGMLFALDFEPRPMRPSEFKPAEVQQVFGAREVRYLNRGSYGEAWLVELDGVGSRVAKILGGASPPSRILREVTALKSVSSPHVVEMHDLQLLNIGGRQRATLIFEFIDGVDLDLLIRSDLWPSAAEVARLAIGVSSGLSALHRAGGIHRDVKLGNIALRGGEFAEPVLLDLGLVRLVDMESITTYPAAVGTPAYMSPQVVAGQRAHPADDMWSFGIVLYLLTARRHPFYGLPAEAIESDEAMERMRAGAPPLDGVGPLGDTVAALLSFERDGRPSAHYVLEILRAG